MRVLGVDPGLTRCGLGVVDGGSGRTITCVSVGVVRSPPDAELPVRLGLIADGVERWLDEFRPDVVAVERVFSQHNVRSAMGTAQAGGVVALLAGRRGLPVRFHTPSEVKAAVTGSGRADKAQVTAMVTRLLRLAEPPKPADAADALALAVCHLWRAPVMDRMARAKAESERLAKAHRARLSEAGGLPDRSASAPGRSASTTSGAGGRPARASSASAAGGAAGRGDPRRSGSTSSGPTASHAASATPAEAEAGGVPEQAADPPSSVRAPMSAYGRNVDGVGAGEGAEIGERGGYATGTRQPTTSTIMARDLGAAMRATANESVSKTTREVRE
ncbi:crossover junction endodeoxyribonuclease RuvC [Actinoalloteichus hoggarensis]|uniref:Crossover junction endodeoxyribonuclease RuvC n=1 Tax=Actinoalloteichus hoggarensis TaxID=1470176 RepID=A0A221W1U8_9PSEU|nr:Crossover junction endodeoxyribonuclease RuvC [Actinoalloteichus hoggarensis]MBB5919566.1 crossover junction endodeoxyribonuclease RuvC [Actinoalloteichus hoggarensis]